MRWRVDQWCSVQTMEAAGYSETSVHLEYKSHPRRLQSSQSIPRERINDLETGNHNVIAARLV